MGAPRWPPNPHRSERPGKPVALLYFARMRSRDTARKFPNVRMSEGRELGADLAAPSGAQAQLQHGRARAALAYAVVGDRLAAAASGPDAQRRGILDDAIAERAGIVAHAALHHRHVAALDGARGKLRLQRVLHRRPLREYQEPRGLAIETVNDEQSGGASRRRG